MNILSSPLLWICGLLYFFVFRKGSSSNPWGSGGNYTTPLPGGTVTNPNGSVTVMPTLTNSRAQSIALQLKEELGNFFTSDSVVLGLFSGLNQADFVMVYNAFGTMTKDLLTPSEGGFLGTEWNLIQWLVNEMSTSSLKSLKSQFPTIL